MIGDLTDKRVSRHYKRYDYGFKRVFLRARPPRHCIAG